MYLPDYWVYEKIKSLSKFLQCLLKPFGYFYRTITSIVVKNNLIGSNYTITGT